MEKVTKVVIRFLAIVAIVGLLGMVMIHFFSYSATDEAKGFLSRENVTRTSSEYKVEAIGEVRAVMVFYQGGLVETASYLPLAYALSEEGITVIMPRMPLNLAIIGRNRALEYEDLVSDVPFIVAGHSLGAASAAFYAESHGETLDGLIFLAGYPSENTDLSHLDVPVLSITASEDEVLDWDLFEQTKENLPAHTVFASIEGGNHAQFGRYGVQRGDGEAFVSKEAQLSETVQLILSFLALP